MVNFTGALPPRGLAGLWDLFHELRDAVSTLASSSPQTGIPAGAPTRALGILRAGLAARGVSPCRLVFTGSSTTAGSNATAEANRYVNRLIAALQAAYPSGVGSETTVVFSDSASFGTLSNAPGVHGYNAGEGGKSSADYLTSAEMTRIAALSPRMVMHMIGSNDAQLNRAPATFKTTAAAKITSLKSQISGPCVHVLVQSYERYDLSNPTYPWAQYGAALSEIAAADPDNVAFIDISPTYVLMGIPGSDPLDLIDTDLIHQKDAGHALMADLLREALGATAPVAAVTPSTATPDTTAPTTPSTPVATAGTASATVTTSAATDNVGVTGYRWYRGGVQVGTSTGTAFTETGLLAGTPVAYTVAATDAAGNLSPASSESNAVTPTAAAPVVLTTYSSDSFTGPATATMVDRSTDAALGGTVQPYTVSTADAALQGTTTGLARGATAAAQFVALPMPSKQQSVKAKITDAPSTAGSLYLIVRRASLTTGTSYRAAVGASTASLQVTNSSGAATDLGPTTSYVEGDEIEARAIDSVIGLYKNGSLIGEVVNSAVTSSGYSGVSVGSATTSFRVDDIVWQTA